MNYISYIFKLFKSHIRSVYNGVYYYPLLRNRNIFISFNARISNCSFEGFNAIYDNSKVIDSTIGYGSYISKNCDISKVKIGRFCSLGQNVQNRFSLHPSRVFVSTHPAFYSTRKQSGFTFSLKNKFEENRFADSEKRFFAIIGNDVWIGSNVSIMKGITINDGAIIATGSIIVSDVPAYSIYGGVPAKFIRDRFDPITIQNLLKIRWWDKDLKELRDNADLFTNINEFIKYYGNNEEK